MKKPLVFFFFLPALFTFCHSGLLVQPGVADLPSVHVVALLAPNPSYSDLDRYRLDQGKSTHQVEVGASYARHTYSRHLDGDLGDGPVRSSHHCHIEGSVGLVDVVAEGWSVKRQEIFGLVGIVGVVLDRPVGWRGVQEESKSWMREEMFGHLCR